MDNKSILENTPVIENVTPQVVEGRVVGKTAGRKLTSDETIGDRPVRKYFLHIIFSLLAIMAVAMLAAILFFRTVHPSAGGNTSGRTGVQHQPKDTTVPQ